MRGSEALTLRDRSVATFKMRGSGGTAVTHPATPWPTAAPPALPTAPGTPSLPRAAAGAPATEPPLVQRAAALALQRGRQVEPALAGLDILNGGSHLGGGGLAAMPQWRKWAQTRRSSLGTCLGWLQLR